MIKFLRSIGKYLPYIRVASVSELKSEVSRSYLNWLWWFLDPLCFMLVYVFIGEVIFKTRPEDFPIFVMVGLTMWTVFNKSCTLSVKIVQSNIRLLQQIYIPKPVLILVKMMVNIYKMVFGFIIIAFMMIAYKIPLSTYVFNLIPIFFVLFLFTFALCVWLMHVGVYVADFENIISVILRLLFYCSGIFYSIPNQLDAKYANLLNYINPMAFLLTEARNALVYAQPANYWLLLYWGIISVVIASVGIAVVYRYENGYAKVVQ